jgi:hypothetical protein
MKFEVILHYQLLTWKELYIYLGSTLLHTTSDNDFCEHNNFVLINFDFFKNKNL